MANVKVFADRQTDKQTDRRTGQKLYAPDLSIRGHKNDYQQLNGLVTRNMKALSLAIQTIWPMLKFLKSGSNFKVKVTMLEVLVPIDRSCHKEHTYDI